jgi:hypothetical protein
MKRIFLENVKPLTHEQIVERRKKVEYEKTKFYVNRLAKDVYIRDRSGLLTRIKPRVESAAFEYDSFYICEQLQCTPDLSNDYIQQSRQTSNSMRQYAHRIILNNWTGEPPLSSRYSVEALSPLSLKTLLENEGIVYLEEHDVVVLYDLTVDQMMNIHHPYSLAGYTINSLQQVREDNPNLRRGDFTFNIRIVDNNDQFGSRWLLIDDNPFCIVASKDDHVTDGIYVTYSKNMLSGRGPQKLMTDRFEFKDGANLPYYKLYESQQEALLARRSTQIDEAWAKIKELESKTTTAENGLNKAKQERENIEREAQLKKQRHEQDMEKLQKEHQKLLKEHELYMQKNVGEMLSVGRKNTMELIKCVPVIIAAITCTMSLFKKK